MSGVVEMVMPVKPETTGELIAHYVDRFPKRKPGLFIAVDAYARLEKGDPVMDPDDDGDLLASHWTYELIGNAGWDARLYIREGANLDDLKRLVQKMTAWVATLERTGPARKDEAPLRL